MNGAVDRVVNLACVNPGPQALTETAVAWQAARERVDFLEQSLLDTSLGIEERVALLMLSQTLYCCELGAGLLEALTGIASGHDDPAIRISALTEFGRSTRPEYLIPVIDALHENPDSSVRPAMSFAGARCLGFRDPAAPQRRTLMV